MFPGPGAGRLASVPTLPFRPVIELAFDPIAQVGDWHVRLQTIGLAAVILVCLLLAARIAGRTPVVTRHPASAIDPSTGAANHLRRDDLLYIAIAALPGAVIGGRLGYALIHGDYYMANPAAILDLGQGAYELSLAVVGGTITAAIVASLLDSPVARWMWALIVPLLFGLAAGKAAMILGGDGQGVPWDGTWATAYLGPGPWLSLAPEVPSHPSQAYEALATLGVLLVVVVLRGSGRFPGRGAGMFLFGLGLWAIARLLVAFTWRDPVVAGPFSAAQLLALAIAIVSFGLLAVGAARARRSPAGADAGGTRFGPDPEPEWPDPASRPAI